MQTESLRIALACIFYNPTVQQVNEIRSYAAFFENSYCWINGDKNDVFEQYYHAPSIKIIKSQFNVGLAIPLNKICLQAIEDKYDIILFSDQDSKWEVSTLQRYIQKLKKIDWSSVALVGATYNNSELKSSQTVAIPVHTVITSGSAINLNLYSAIGGFDEKLFIDEIDHDYSYTATSLGYSILKFEDIYFEHAIGKPNTSSVFGIQSRPLHDPWRFYYLVRNYFYIHKKHSNLTRAIIQERQNRLVSRIKHNLFFNNKRINILYYILKGIFDYSTSRMGQRTK